MSDVLSQANAAFALRHSDPEQGLALAEALVSSFGSSNDAGDQLFARAVYANALRTVGRYGRAERVMISVLPYAHHLAEPQRAAVWELAGSLWENLRNFPAAASALREALAIREILGDQVRLASCLVQQGNALGHQGLSGQAIAATTRALTLIEVQEAPLMAAGALHNLAWFMVDFGLPARAQEIVLEQEARGVVLRGPGEDLRRRWLLARIAAGIPGGLEIAEEEFSAIAVAYDRASRVYEAALVAVEKAAAEVRLGHWAAAGDTLCHVELYFEFLGVEREATAARLLREAAFNQMRAEAVLPRLMMALRQVPLRARH